MAVIILILSVANLITAAEIKDINSTHWAYQSVKELVEKGYLSVYPDNTFRGNEPVDRYTLASVIARVIKEMQSGKANILTDDIDILKKLYEEFDKKLAANTLDLNKIDTRVSSLEKGIGINNEEITRFQLDFDNQVNAIFSSLNNTKSNLQDQIKVLRDELNSIKEEKASSAAVDLAISNAIQRASTDIQEANKEQEKLKEDFNEQQRLILEDINKREKLLRSEFNDELAVIKLDMDNNLKAEIEALKTDLAMKGQNFDILASQTDASIKEVEESMGIKFADTIQSLDSKYTQKLEQADNEFSQVKADLGTVITAMENKMSNEFVMLNNQIQNASKQAAGFEAKMTAMEQLQNEMGNEFERLENQVQNVSKQSAAIEQAQNKIQEQIDTLKLANNLRATKENTIENRIQKLEDNQKSIQESNQARLQALEKNRTIWHMGFGLSLVAIVIAIVGFYR